jgi:pyridoxine/pyridoxamine 5'-phosphate oxidase
MARLIGDRLPAPLRFELGLPPEPGAAARAVLLATVDEDGSPRIAVLSTSEIQAPDESRLHFELHAESATCKNVAARCKAAVWYVLDAAAYTVKGSTAASSAAAKDGWRAFDLAVESVWQDFEAGAPMIGGPTYRAPEGP